MQLYVFRVIEILNVVDGDTYDCTISLGFGIRASFRFRLTGVDAPEVYGPEASEKGKDARAFVVAWLPGRSLVVETEKSSGATVGIGDGAFGRWLGDLIDVDTGERLSEAVREAGYDTMGYE